MSTKTLQSYSFSVVALKIDKNRLELNRHSNLVTILAIRNKTAFNCYNICHREFKVVLAFKSDIYSVKKPVRAMPLKGSDLLVTNLTICLRAMKDMSRLSQLEVRKIKS